MDKAIVRAGTLDDIPAIVDMAREFWTHTIYQEDYCPDTVKKMAEFCIESQLMSVIDMGGVVGFACGIKAPLLGNSKISAGAELAWWINPDNRKGSNGVKLLRHLENQAKEAGIKYWSMVYMESSMPEVVEKIYEKLGYNRTEVTYSKVL